MKLRQIEIDYFTTRKTVCSKRHIEILSEGTFNKSGIAEVLMNTCRM